MSSRRKKHTRAGMNEKRNGNTLHHVQSIEFVQYFGHFVNSRHDFNSYALICYLFYKYTEIESKREEK